MLSGATRRFKTFRRKRDQLPIGAMVDGSRHQQASTGDMPQPAARGFSMDGKRGPSMDYNGGMGQQQQQQQQPATLPLYPSDSSGKATMTGSATQDDIIVFRLTSWRSLVKEYIDYFGGILAIEKSVCKSLEKTTGELAVPLKTDHCLSGIERQGGVQQLGAQLREVHRMYAAQHARAAQSLEGNTLKQLDALRSDIKSSLKMYTDHLGPIYRRLRKQAKDAEDAKEKLAHAVEAYKKKHKGQDAWLAQQQVRRELTKQADIENALFKAVQAERARLARWEVTVCERLRDIVASAAICDRDCAQTNVAAIAGCLSFMDRFDTAAEQRAFDASYGSAMNVPLGLTGASSLADYDYMHRDSELAGVLLEGPLEREKGLIRAYKPTYAVLTAQGNLHCYAEQKDLLEKNPDMSFHLSDCTVRPLDDACVFQLVVGGMKLGHSRVLFRASDPKYVDHWLNAILSVSAKPATLENTVIGGTLRHSKAAEDAAAANASAPTNALPTAAGVTFGELHARNLSEDSTRNLSHGNADHGNGTPAEAPGEAGKFYPARGFDSAAQQEIDSSPHTTEGTRIEGDTAEPNVQRRSTLPSYAKPNEPV
ncbi:hypothetical protein GGI23_001431 [Coemansia sp. RSA 2559]|nr:hypothetical protein GGI23_001431 [Coemansia sp. RSA 2559]